MLLWIKKKHIWKKKGDCAGNPSNFLLAVFPLFFACIRKEEAVVFLSNNCVTLWYQFEFKKTPASPAFTYVSHLFWLLLLFLSLSLSSPLSLPLTLSVSDDLYFSLDQRFSSFLITIFSIAFPVAGTNREHIFRGTCARYVHQFFACSILSFDYEYSHTRKGATRDSLTRAKCCAYRNTIRHFNARGLVICKFYDQSRDHSLHSRPFTSANLLRLLRLTLIVQKPSYIVCRISWALLCY